MQQLSDSINDTNGVLISTVQNLVPLLQRVL